MNKRLFILISLLVVLIVGVAAAPPSLPYNTLKQLVAYLEGRGNTFSGTNTFSGSNTFTGPLTASDARLGISPFQLAAAKSFATTEFDGKVYYLTGNSPAYTVRFPTFSNANGYGLVLMDGRPDGGLTIWNSGTSLWYGTGSQGGTGSTVWFNAGSASSGWTIQAFPTIRNGVIVVKLIAPDTTFSVLP